MQVDKTPYGTYSSAPTYAVPKAESDRTLETQEGQEARDAQSAKLEEQESLIATFQEWQKQQEQTGSFSVSKDGAGNFNVSTSKPKDDSGTLTQRLVRAGGQFEVRQVAAEAQTSLLKLRMLAAASKGEDAQKARAYIKKLQKLVDRCYNKIQSLDKEDLLKVQKARAQKQKQQKKAEEIKAKLRKEQMARHVKENGYLRELAEEAILGGGVGTGISQPRLDAATEAQIEAQAQVMAAMETAAESAGSGADVGGGGECEVSFSGGDGESAAPSPEGGSCDIAV